MKQLKELFSIEKKPYKKLFALEWVTVCYVLFTLMHAAIQTFVLSTLVSFFYGEAVEPRPPKVKKERTPKKPKKAEAETA